MTTIFRQTKRFFGNKKTRIYIYSVGIAGTTLLGAYGIIQENYISLWNFFISAVLGLAVGKTGDITKTTEDGENDV